MPTYTSQYPPAYSDTYAKATTWEDFGTAYDVYNPLNPAVSLTGGMDERCWLSTANTNQRYHVDLGTAVIIRRIYYENHHSSGGNTTQGARTFTFWGSNEASAFSTVTYATDTNWTELTSSITELDQHTAANTADPKYGLITNTVAYRYYAFKFSNNWGAAGAMGLRRVEFQTEDGYSSSSGTTGHSNGAHWYYKKNRRRYVDQDPFKANR